MGITLMPNYTKKMKAEIQEEARKAFEQGVIQEEKRKEDEAKYHEELRAGRDVSGGGHYVQVLGENEYGKQMGPIKHDDSWELIIPFDGKLSPGYKIYIDRNNEGVLEQRIKEEDPDYRAERKREYPRLTDQLDMIYHDIDGWRETIKDIKERNPKGE